MIAFLSFVVLAVRELKDRIREMENISRGHFPHKGVDAGRLSCKTTEYKSRDSPLPPVLNVMYCVRVSLWTVKIFLAQN
jgi:hypothetical protein